MQLEAFDHTCKLLDIIYNPWQTPLMSQASKQGIPSANGLSMFIYQAVQSFKIWTQIAPDPNLMRSVALSQLRLPVS
jgi:shikimate dehydrogenase